MLTRPATAADAPAIHQLIVACELDLNGEAETTLDRVAADLARPAIDLDHDTLLVHDADGALVAWAWVHMGRRAEIAVHPWHRGLHLGTRLLNWVEERARDRGSVRLGQTVHDADTAAATLLRAHGYAAKATQWLLSITSSAEPVAPVPPAGITLRPFATGDARRVYEVVEGAFNEWQQRPRGYEEWAQLTIERETFAPALSPLAFAGDQLVGAVLSLELPDGGEGYVDRLAVHRDFRHRGVAATLLRQAFRDFYRVGRRTCVLYTHSETGALALYERVGMTVRRSSTHYSKPLDWLAMRPCQSGPAQPAGDGLQRLTFAPRPRSPHGPASGFLPHASPHRARRSGP